MGANRHAVEVTLKHLAIDAPGSVRAQLCLTLADQLDQEMPVNVAAVARELRMVIAELESSSIGDDEFTTFMRSLSEPLADTED